MAQAGQQNARLCARPVGLRLGCQPTRRGSTRPPRPPTTLGRDPPAHPKARGARRPAPCLSPTTVLGQGPTAVRPAARLRPPLLGSQATAGPDNWALSAAGPA